MSREPFGGRVLSRRGRRVARARKVGLLADRMRSSGGCSRCSRRGPAPMRPARTRKRGPRSRRCADRPAIRSHSESARASCSAISRLARGDQADRGVGQRCDGRLFRRVSRAEARGSTNATTRSCTRSARPMTSTAPIRCARSRRRRHAARRSRSCATYDDRADHAGSGATRGECRGRSSARGEAGRRDARAGMPRQQQQRHATRPWPRTRSSSRRPPPEIGTACSIRCGRTRQTSGVLDDAAATALATAWDPSFVAWLVGQSSVIGAPSSSSPAI